jgi:hypothetical protein
MDNRQVESSHDERPAKWLIQIAGLATTDSLSGLYPSYDLLHPGCVFELNDPFILSLSSF